MNGLSRTGIVLLLALAGCASTGELAPNLPERIANDAACLQAMTAAGLTLAAPGGAAVVAGNEALRIISRINEVGTSNLPATVLGACAKTIEYAAQDAAAIKARAKEHLDKNKAAPAVAPAVVPVP
jgi:hypothetical protein